ncbi:MAG: DUF6259 domain-containing protein [Eubacteriales bacterium]
MKEVKNNSNKAQTEKTCRFYGGGLSYRVSVLKGGAACASLRDTKAKKPLYSGNREIFSLTSRNLTTGDEVTVSSLSGWGEVSVSSSGGSGCIVFGKNKSLPGVTVIVAISGSEDFLTFDTELINISDIFSLQSCHHPFLYCGVGKNIRFFYPFGCGETKPSDIKEGWRSVQSYPSYGASMQYLCFWNEKSRRGVYYGCHDPKPASKKLVCSRGETDDIFTFGAFQILSGITKGQNSQKLCGSLKLRAFDGDWYDGALIYKDFIENVSGYCSDYDENGKKGLPEWLKNTDFWFNYRVLGDGEFAGEIIKEAEKLGVSPAVHMYYWHQIPYDNDYPHYFPMKPNIEGELKKLHAAGIKVMPYINGRLWDTRDRGVEDFEYTSVAKPYATKNILGEPITETYNSKESDGSKVKLAVMCPATTLWQDKVCEIVKKLFEVGFDGVYIDQIAAAEAKPCADPSHKHPAGGGDWWCYAYNTLLERISRTKPKEAALTTECTADPFLKHLDGYLSWLWIRNEQVPAFPAVFSDKIITFGSDYRGIGNLDFNLFGSLDEAGVRVFAAQSFLFGQQMGWMTPELFSRIPHQDFVIRLVRARAKFRGYFLGGRVLRPPVIKDDGGKIKITKCREAYRGYVESDCVNGMLWQEKSTGKTALILINSGDKTVTARVRSLLPDGRYNLFGENGKSGEVDIRQGSFETKMPPLSLRYIEVL